MIKRWDLTENGSREPMAEYPKGDWVEYEDYALEISGLCQQIEDLRNELTACQLERDRLGALIAQHNSDCKMSCDSRGNCEPFTMRRRRCPDCPQDWVIEIGAEPQSENQT